MFLIIGKVGTNHTHLSCSKPGLVSRHSPYSSEKSFVIFAVNDGFFVFIFVFVYFLSTLLGSSASYIIFLGERRHKMRICFIVGLSANRRLFRDRQTKPVPGRGPFQVSWRRASNSPPVQATAFPGNKLGNKTGTFLLINPPVSFPRPHLPP